MGGWREVIVGPIWRIVHCSISRGLGDIWVGGDPRHLVRYGFRAITYLTAKLPEPAKLPRSENHHNPTPLNYSKANSCPMVLKI
jgi:hypothetical protein